MAALWTTSTPPPAAAERPSGNATAASVVITPAGSTSRTRLLRWSAMATAPSGSCATPVGKSSRACVAGPPSPEKPPRPVPATVVMIPRGDTRRMRWRSVSATRKPPSGVAATAVGNVSRASPAGPPSPVGGGIEIIGRRRNPAPATE